MSLIIKIGWFLAFLALLAATSYAGFVIFRRQGQWMLESKMLRALEANLVIATVMLFGPIYLLTGFFSWQLLLLFILGSHVGLVVAGVLWALVGAPASNWAARLLSAGGEFGYKFPRLFKAAQLLPAILLLVFPVAAGIAYFRAPGPSPELTIEIFRWALVTQFGALPLTLAMIVALLVSPNVDQHTRTRVFTSQTGGLVPMALYLALALWAYGVAGRDVELPWSMPLAVTSHLWLVLLAFFLFAVVVPYFIGTRRARQWQAALQEEERSWLARLAYLLSVPTGREYVAALQEMRSELAQQAEQWSANDPIFSLERDLRQVRELPPNMPLPPGVREVTTAFFLCRPSDPRFVYADNLRSADAEIQRVIENLQQRTQDSERETAAKTWAEAFEARRELLKEKIEEMGGKTPALVLGLSAVFLPILTVALDQVANLLWETFKKSL